MPWEHLRVEIKTAKSPAAGKMSSPRRHWAGVGAFVKKNGCGQSQKWRYLTQALARGFFIVMTAGKKSGKGKSGARCRRWPLQEETTEAKGGRQELWHCP